MDLMALEITIGPGRQRDTPRDKCITHSTVKTLEVHNGLQTKNSLKNTTHFENNAFSVFLFYVLDYLSVQGCLFVCIEVKNKKNKT